MAGLLGLAYAILATPYYSVQSVRRPAALFPRQSASVADLTQAGQTLEQTFEAFNKDAFELLQPDTKKPEATTPSVAIQLTYPQQLDGVQIVNGFVQYSLDEVRKEIAADLETLIGIRLSQLDKKMAAARES
ncbi:hypothetical protein [Stutzerimonas marianensis]